MNDNGNNDRINAVFVDSAGYVWLATDQGVARYNGRNFTRLSDSIHKPATAIFADGDTIWVGYANGVIGTVRNSFVERTPLADGPGSYITSICRNGAKLWVSTQEQGIFCIESRRSTWINSANGLADNFIYSICPGPEGTLLSGSDAGLNSTRNANGKINIGTYTTRQGLPDNIITVIRCDAGCDNYWIGTEEGGLALYNSRTSSIMPLKTPARWQYGQVNDILPLKGGRAWIATDQGFLVEAILGSDNTCSIHPFSYPGKVFTRLAIDKAGNIWCGSTHGLSLCTGEYLMHIKLPLPYSLQGVTAIAWNNGAPCIALKRKLYRIHEDQPAVKMQQIVETKRDITTLYEDTSGRLWIGTLGDGIYSCRNDQVTHYPPFDGLDQKASILNINGNDSKLWVSTLKGVEELSIQANGKLQFVKHHSKKTGIGSDYVYQLFPDRKGNVWIATDGAGVCMYDGKEYHHWDTAFARNNKVAYSVTEDQTGNIWAATMDRDLFCFNGKNWNNLRRSETQYADVNISAVTANATGQVISVYQRCVDEWYPGSKYFRHFNSALGLGIDSTSDVVNCTARDMEGNVYTPYQQGLLIFRNQREDYDISPAVHISTPTLFSRPLLQNRHDFNYDESYVGFNFDGTGQVNHERFNYRYMLEGYNDNWVYTSDASASFARLPPGKYKFRVQVSLNPAFDHPSESTYAFIIATPYWRTTWFYLASALVVIGIAYSYIKLREKRIEHLSQLKQERMMFEYEHLKSQVNPHFLFNSLYTLSILIEEKRDDALSYTMHLADLYRNTLSTTNKNLILLKDELDILADYVTIQKTRFGDALNVIVDIANETKENTQVVPLAIQLLVENAIKHNVVSLATPLTIHVEASDSEITVRNHIQPKLSKEKGAGIGLANISKRYSLLTRRPMTYGITENEFIVKLPLL